MKNHSFVKCWGFLFTIFLYFNINAQSPTYKLLVTNEAQPAPNQYEFDIFLLSTGSPFELSHFGAGLAFDVSIINSGVLSAQIVAGSSELVSAQVPNSVSIGAASSVTNGVTYRYFNISPRASVGAGNGTMISNIDGGCLHPGTRIARFRIINTVPFAPNSTCKHRWSQSAGSGRNNTIISYYNGGISTNISVSPWPGNINYDMPGSCIIQPNGIILTECSNPASANAGPDTSLLADGSAVVLNPSFGGFATSATWSGGTGVFIGNNYQPSNTDYINGSVILTYTTDDPDSTGPCVAASDNVTINFWPGYKLIVTNESNPSPDIYEFDIFILATSLPFQLASVSIGLAFDTAIINGYNATASIVGLSELNTSQVPTTVSIGTQTYVIGNTTYRYFNVSPSPGSSTISNVDGGCTHPGTRIARFRITNPVPFTTNSTCKHLFSESSGSGKLNTTLSYYAGATPITMTQQENHLGYNHPSSCILQPNGIIINPPLICSNPPTVDAGMDQSICKDQSSIILSPIVGGSGSNHFWSGGTGIFTGNTYQPSQGDYNNGSIILTATTNDPDGVGPCEAATDHITISFVEPDTYFADNDGDGFGSGAPIAACAQPPNTSVNDLDCNDSNAAINPNATEICNGNDDNCNGSTDEGVNVDDNNVCTIDACDGINGLTHTPVIVDDNNVCTTDGCDPLTGPTYTFIDIDDNDICTVDACDPITGITHNSIDTDDNDVCTIDGCDPINGVFHTLIDLDVDGYSTCAGDCNDNDNSIYPGAIDICNDLIDQDCDGIDFICDCVNPSIANAGSDQIICGNGTVFLNGIIGGGATVGVWTSSGTGNFVPNAYTLNATYLPSLADQMTGSVTMTLTTDYNFACEAAVDTLMLTFVQSALMPGPITGPSYLCNPPESVAFVYSVEAVPGAVSYNWTVPVGAAIVSGQGSNTISVSFISGALNSGIAGQICVTAINGGICGASNPSCHTISVQLSAPVTPGSVSGATRACPSDIGVYSIAPVSRAAYYLWALPSGAAIIGNGNGNIITVSFDSTFGGGNLTVRSANACGISPARSRYINLNPLPAPSSISGTTSGLCGEQNKVFTAVPVVGAYSYIWTIPSGATIDGSLNGNSINIDFSNTMTSGTITAKGVNGCGNGASRSLTVSGAPGVAGAVSGPNLVCVNSTHEYQVATVNGASNYAWTAPGAIIGGQGNKAITVQYGSTPTAGQVITVQTANECGTSPIRLLNAITIQSCPRLSSESTHNFNVYPNPATDLLSIDFSSETGQNYVISIIDVSGRIVYSESNVATAGSNNLLLDVKMLTSGVYMLNFKMEDDNELVRIMIE